MFDQVVQVWDRLTAPAAVPGFWALAITLLAATVLLRWRVSAPLVRQLCTIAHEAGHALAAVLTRREAVRVHVRPDGSGTTDSRGRDRGSGAALVSFAGYPFPAAVGAGLLVAAASGQVRLPAAGAALALLLLLLRMRNVHGWLVVALAAGACGAGAWWMPGGLLSLAVVVAGWWLVAGSVGALLDERRSRRLGSGDSDVSALARRGRLPAGAYWASMLACVLGCGWWAASTWADAVALPW